MHGYETNNFSSPSPNSLLLCTKSEAKYTTIFIIKTLFLIELYHIFQSLKVIIRHNNATAGSKHLMLLIA